MSLTNPPLFPRYLAAIAAELYYDPLGYGYSTYLALGKYDIVQRLLNTSQASIQIPQPLVDTKDLLAAIAPGDIKATTDRNSAKWFRDLFKEPAQTLLTSSGAATATGAGVLALLTNPSDSYTRVSALGTRNGARSEQILGVGVFVSIDDIRACLIWSPLIASAISGSTTIPNVTLSILLGLDLEDTFSTDRSAGTVNGTAADGRTPTMTRTVVDTESKLSVSGGKLSVSGNNSSWSSQWLRYPVFTITPGMVFLSEITPSSGFGPMFGFAPSSSISELTGRTLHYRGGDLAFIKSASTYVNVGAYSYGSRHNTAIVCRGTGAWLFVNNKLYYIQSSASESTAYPAMLNYSSAFTSDNIRIPKTLYVPTPIASDSFNRALLGSTDGAGHAEANGGSGLTWQTGANNTWSIAGGKLVNTPTTGTEKLVNGDFSNWASPTDANNWTESASGGGSVNREGTTYGSAPYGLRLDIVSGNLVYVTQNISSQNAWHRLGITAKASVANTFAIEDGTGTIFTSPAIPTTAMTPYVFSYRSGAAADKFLLKRSSGSTFSFYFDDVSLKQIPLSDLFATVNAGTPDVIVDVTIAHSAMGTSGIQAGVVLNLDSPTNPQNFVLVYFDGIGNIRAEKATTSGGTLTYTPIWSNITSHSSTQVLRVVRDSVIGEYRVFFNNAAINSVITTAEDSALKTGTYFGTFSTSSTATFSNFTVWARGTNGEYATLDTL